MAASCLRALTIAIPACATIPLRATQSQPSPTCLRNPGDGRRPRPDPQGHHGSLFSPSYILPIHGLQRLEKIMDEYVGGISTNDMTNGKLLERGLELLTMLKEDMKHVGAEDVHLLQRTWESGSRC